MAQFNPSIDEQLKKLREKKAEVAAGNPPVGIGDARVTIVERVIEEESDPLELEALRIQVTDLKNLLRRTAVHVAARNAMGEKSKEFCTSCNNARHEGCVLPEIWTALEG